jgi:hypothetical protein
VFAKFSRQFAEIRLRPDFYSRLLPLPRGMEWQTLPAATGKVLSVEAFPWAHGSERTDICQTKGKAVHVFISN